MANSCLLSLNFNSSKFADEAINVPDELVMNEIYLIRNHKVMLDKDLAALYGNKSVKTIGETELKTFSGGFYV